MPEVIVRCYMEPDRLREAPCEVVKKGKIYRCSQYMQFTGKNPQTGEEFNEWGCAEKFKTLAQLDGNRMVKSVAAGQEGLRNSIKELSGNFKALNMLAIESRDKKK